MNRRSNRCSHSTRRVRNRLYQRVGCSFGKANRIFFGFINVNFDTDWLVLHSLTGTYPNFIKESLAFYKVLWGFFHTSDWHWKRLSRILFSDFTAFEIVSRQKNTQQFLYLQTYVESPEKYSSLIAGLFYECFRKFPEIFSIISCRFATQAFSDTCIMKCTPLIIYLRDHNLFWDPIRNTT